MKIPNRIVSDTFDQISLARIVSEDSQLLISIVIAVAKSSKDS